MDFRQFENEQLFESLLDEPTELPPLPGLKYTSRPAIVPPEKKPSSKSEERYTARLPLFDSDKRPHPRLRHHTSSNGSEDGG